MHARVLLARMRTTRMSADERISAWMHGACERVVASFCPAAAASRAHQHCQRQRQLAACSRLRRRRPRITMLSSTAVRMHEASARPLDSAVPLADVSSSVAPALS